MTTAAEVRLWGRRVGTVALIDGEEVASFEYDREFLGSGIELSPITMPLGGQVYRFPQLPRETFVGLPGLLADSLPDRFGNALIDAWLTTQGRAPGSLNPVERLCYTGSRGMGALEFEPALGPSKPTTEALVVEQLVALASQVLSNRDALSVSFDDASRAEALAGILQVGTSAGGARAKAVIAYNPLTHEVRSGQLEAAEGFEHWLLKFDGVTSNGDKDVHDPQGYCAIEYAYSLMAKGAGIEMTECRLLEEGRRRHFMTRRFDRTATGGKLHMQSMGGLGHYDFNLAGAHSYEQAFGILEQLQLAPEAREQLFRRMVFNVVARNQDDHVKNISLLMDRKGQWSLSPAYDVTHSYRPDGQWTSSHQMSIAGKRDDFSLADFEACGKTARLKRGRARAVLAEVTDVVSRWNVYAKKAGVDAALRKAIAKDHRLALLPPVHKQSKTRSRSR